MEGKKVYFQAFGTLWDAKGYYRIRGDHLILQVIKIVPAIGIARGHVRGRRVFKDLPPMQIRVSEGVGLLETVQNEFKMRHVYSVSASYHSFGNLTPLRY